MIKESFKESVSPRLNSLGMAFDVGGYRSQYATSANKTLQLLTPRRLVPRMVVSIFIAECFVMLVLALLPPLSLTIEALIDSTFLLILLSPTFYFFHYRPLFQHHQERKKVIDRLSASEERLGLTLNAVNDGLCDWNIRTGQVYFSQRAQAMLGFQGDEFGDDIHWWQHLIHPDDEKRVLKVLDDHLQGKSSYYETEHRLQKEDGDYIWVLTRGQVVSRDKHGEPLRMVGTHTDITVRKQAETALRKSEEEIRALTQRLMSNSEEEKKHLAQDLHDEFGQVLTAFQLGVEMLRSHTYQDEEDYQFHCARLLKMVDSLEANLRHICDHLRPIMLDDVGLIETLRWHIKELILLDNSVVVDFQVSGEERPLSRDIEIAFYRIVQESLNNVAKHSGAKKVEVKVDFCDGEIRLSIVDDGKGFSEQRIRTGQRRISGFGLLGMRERASAVGGQLDIASKKGEGTWVQLVAPLG